MGLKARDCFLQLPSQQVVVEALFTFSMLDWIGCAEIQAEFFKCYVIFAHGSHGCQSQMIREKYTCAFRVSVGN